MEVLLPTSGEAYANRSNILRSLLALVSAYCFYIYVQRWRNYQVRIASNLVDELI